VTLLQLICDDVGEHDDAYTVVMGEHVLETEEETVED